MTNINIECPPNIVPDVVAIEGFLRECVKDNIQLVAITPDGPTLGHWFGADAGAAAQWAEQQNAQGKNVYWTVNVVRGGLHKKAEKSDIVEARLVHADIDSDGPNWDKAAALDRLRAKKPSVIIDSGGGLQAFWPIEPTAMPDEEARRLVEGMNYGVAQALGGDACWNIDRIMRVPGTINYPNVKKQKAGRIPVMARLLEHTPASEPWTIEPPPPSTGEPYAPGHAGTDYLDPPPDDKLRRMIENPDAADPAKGDRSARVYGVACAMIERYYSDEQIARVLSNPALPIAAHCIEQKGYATALRQAQRARADILAKRRMLLPKPEREDLLPVTIDAFLGMDIPPRKLLLAPYLPEAGIAMLYAPRGIGKTWAALSIAYAVASGSSVLNGTASEPHRVLYIDGEMPVADLQARLKLVAAGAKKSVPDGSYFNLLPDGLRRDGLGNLASSEKRAEVEGLARYVKLVVFDNISSLFSYRENEADGWQPIQDMLLSLRRQGISSLLIHHAAKGGQQRGTSRREDVLDTVIALRRPEDYEASQGAVFHWHYEKARGFMGDEAEPFEARLVMGPQGMTWETSQIAESKRDVALAMLENGATVADVMKETGVPRATLYRWRNEAVQSHGETIANAIRKH